MPQGVETFRRNEVGIRCHDERYIAIPSRATQGWMTIYIATRDGYTTLTNVAESGLTGMTLTRWSRIAVLRATFRRVGYARKLQCNAAAVEIGIALTAHVTCNEACATRIAFRNRECHAKTNGLQSDADLFTAFSQLLARRTP